MSANELRQAFRDLAAEVKVAPDPYPRIMKRGRKTRRMKGTAWSGLVAGAVVAILFGPVGLQVQTAPQVVPSKVVEGGYPMTSWTRKLIDAPTRGGLAGDRAFVSSMSAQIGRFEFGSLAGAEVKVLFAQDIGEHRLVVAARFTDANQTGFFMAGAKGASAAELLPLKGSKAVTIKALSPYTVADYAFGGQTMSYAGVGLAPEGCVVATQVNGQWQDSTTGTYVTWSEPALAKAAKVTCDGVERYEGPLSDHDIPVEVFMPEIEWHIDKALEGHRGVASRGIVSLFLSRHRHLQATGPMRILYGGSIPGDFGNIYVAALPLPGGCWLVDVIRSDSSAGGYVTAVDVGDPSVVLTVFAPVTNSLDSRMLVLAPENAATLEVRDKANVLRETVTLKRGVGVVTLLESQRSVQLRALDANHVQVGAGTGPTPIFPDGLVNSYPDKVENWS
ncbi:MAG TPA: hypothetical protein DGT23_30660 [Micromonosporaceae bacterium]|nr:hypothetical protein [Micromonosporaceae bacterium]